MSRFAQRVRALTPKEFAEAIGGLLCADTVRARCKSGEIKTVGGPGRPPYLIPASELDRFISVPACAVVA